MKIILLSGKEFLDVILRGDDGLTKSEGFKFRINDLLSHLDPSFLKTSYLLLTNMSQTPTSKCQSY